MLSQGRKPVKTTRPVTVSDFKFVGGSLCLDFVNTLGERGSLEMRDKLVRFRDLIRWSEQAGIIKHAEANRILQLAEAHGSTARTVLKRAIALREALYRIFKSHVQVRKPLRADLKMLNREIRAMRARESLAYSAGDFRWIWDEDDTLDRPLWPVVLSAAKLMTSSNLRLLRQCDDEKCGWMFLDTSRNHSRHWCDMRDCGNRAKVARFRQRWQRQLGRLSR